MVKIEEPREPDFMTNMEPAQATQLRRQLKLLVTYSYTEPTQEQKELIGPESELQLDWRQIDMVVAYQQRAIEFEEDYRKIRVAKPKGLCGVCCPSCKDTDAKTDIDMPLLGSGMQRGAIRKRHDGEFRAVVQERAPRWLASLPNKALGVQLPRSMQTAAGGR